MAPVCLPAYSSPSLGRRAAWPFRGFGSIPTATEVTETCGSCQRGRRNSPIQYRKIVEGLFFKIS